MKPMIKCTVDVEFEDGSKAQFSGEALDKIERGEFGVIRPRHLKFITEMQQLINEYNRVNR